MTRVLATKVPDNLYRRFVKIAEERGLTPSVILRRLVEDFVNGRLTTEVNLDRLINDVKAAVLETMGAKLKEFLDRLTNEVNQLLEKVNHERLTSEAVEGDAKFELSHEAEAVCRDLVKRWRRREKLRGRDFVLFELYRLYKFLKEAYRNLEKSPNVFTPEVPAKWVIRELGCSVQEWVEEVRRIRLERFENLKSQFKVYVFNDRVQLDPSGEVFELDRTTEEIRRDVLEALEELMAKTVSDIENLVKKAKKHKEGQTEEESETQGSGIIEPCSETGTQESEPKPAAVEVSATNAGEGSSLAASYSERSVSVSANEEPVFKTAREVAEERASRDAVLDVLYTFESCAFRESEDESGAVFMCGSEIIKEFEELHATKFVEAIKEAAKLASIRIEVEHKMDGAVTVRVSEPEKLMQLKRELLAGR